MQVFDSVKEPSQRYTDFLQRYEGKSANDRMKCALTDTAFALTQKVWMDIPMVTTGERGKCTFCIGGVNRVIPFSAAKVKNEILVYVHQVPQDTPQIVPEEGAFYDSAGKRVEDWDLSEYDEIYMDFNGSMSFFDEKWKLKLSNADVVQKVRRLLFALPRWIAVRRR